MNALQKLVALGSPPLSAEQPRVHTDVHSFGPHAARGLQELLAARNGFFAFESALHVFPASPSERSYDLDAWNSAALWKDTYGALVEGVYCFAQDIFGGQFGVVKEGICTFDPETADVEVIAASVEEWAARVLGDYPALTGHRLAHEWQQVHGPLPSRDRLLPRTPFVGGGDYDVTNLVAIDGARAMRIRGPLARQLHDAPDGTAVTFRLTD